jgi:hypothetical protein
VDLPAQAQRVALKRSPIQYVDAWKLIEID